MYPGQQYNQQQQPPYPPPNQQGGGGYPPMPGGNGGGGYPPNPYGGAGGPGFPAPDGDAYGGGGGMPGFNVPMPGGHDGGVGGYPMPGGFGGPPGPPSYPPNNSNFPPSPYGPPGSGGGGPGGYPPSNTNFPPSPYGPPSGENGAYPPPPGNMGGGYPPQQQQQQQQPPPAQPPRVTNRPPQTLAPNGAMSANPQINNLYQQAGHVQQSQLTGRRRALLIGINYIGQPQALKGCLNDVVNIKRFLIEFFNFRECDMVILTDDSKDPRNMPTRANMTRAMKWLVSDARPNDSYFFHFSGHGSQTTDTTGDEIDGYDETVLPVDYKTAGQITDDEMNAIMVRPLPQGCRLTAVFDSCHSGTALDLPFVYDHQGRLVQNQISELATSSIVAAGKKYLAGDVMSAGKSIFSGLKTAVNGAKIQNKQKQLKSSMADVIMFSGCADSQTSADTYNYAVGNTGAMSHALVSVLRDNHRQTYSQVLANVRQYLKGKYKQVPQLSSGRLMDMNQVFTM
ncbi:Ca(2+)-dependent cysteine protease [Tieghemiomyces parasiticus]|uniref:Ca(2+)-dependent cysteine protease n=1 Tax=Tieghemiomyces parasiticus TaxID=78921 RepID=A0A9W8E2H1_9FUNG|nr:Ca(2+)-dependent cysteine protease [Tieghemiomyces parasiticus]